MLTLFKASEVRDEALIQQIAKEVANAALQQFAPQLADLCPAELRGYLRARLSGEAKSRVRQAIAQSAVVSSNEAEFTTAVLERAIHLTIRDLAAPPVTQTPTVHIATRRAA